MRRFMYLMFMVPLSMLLGSYLGAYHPLGDSLAVFRGPLALVGGGAVLLFLRGGAKGAAMIAAMIAAALVAWSAYTVLAPRLNNRASTDAAFAPYTLYQKNMLFKMPSSTPLRAELLQQTPDFITLQEVSRNNRALLDDLKADYPAQVYCPFAGVGGVVAMARWPLVAGSERCQPFSGMVAMQVETPDGPVWLVSLHLHWPYPKGQAAQVRALLPELAALKGPVVLGGDFNMVPWSHVMRTITAATNTRRIGALQYTLPLKGVYSLPIDHVLVHNTAQPASAEKRPLLGSDHFGILARFSLR